VGYSKYQGFCKSIYDVSIVGGVESEGIREYRGALILPVNETTRGGGI
jgi:hypothetical protein